MTKKTEAFSMLTTSEAVNLMRSQLPSQVRDLTHTIDLMRANNLFNQTDLQNGFIAPSIEKQASLLHEVHYLLGMLIMAEKALATNLKTELNAINKMAGLNLNLNLNTEA